MKQSNVLIGCLFGFLAITANAAIYVDKIEHPKKVVILKIEGRIKHGDEVEFQNTLDEIRKDGYKIKLNSVVLNSRGGNSHAAMEIGKIVRKEYLNTYVGLKHRCASACVYVLTSGIIRMAYGEVAVHRPTFDDDYPQEKLEESLKKAESESMQFFMDMGMTTQLVEAAKITPSWTTWTLDDKEKRRWGVH